MFGLTTKIVITQVSTEQYPGRTKVFTFNFSADESGSSTWAHLTDTFKITLPRAVYFKNEDGSITTWDKTPIYGNPEKQPLILRGDKISVTHGYSYYKPTGSTFDRKTIVTKEYERFSGYITKIKNQTPIQLECEDNMYACKQTFVEDGVWNIDGSPLTLEKLLLQFLKASTFSDAKNFTVVTDNYEHKIQKFFTKHYTLAMVLNDLRKNYHFESFFRGNVLHCGIIRYYPEERTTHQFEFQNNIISNNLDYQRADDVRIGIIAKSIVKFELVSLNSSGKKRTQHKQLEVRVGDMDGEVRTLFFWGVTSEAELKKQALAKMPFIKYEGFRGSFTTFGLPFVKHGDLVQLVNNKLPEMNGTYLVKEVQTECGSSKGLRQTIFLDIRVDGILKDRGGAKVLDELQKTGL